MVRAQGAKAPIQQFADNISAVFVPVVLACCVLTFGVWLLVTYTGAAPSKWYEEEGEFLFSFLFAISTLVIACPCALGLAAPTAVMVGTGVGAKNGILIKGGEGLEKLARVKAIVFDKTGTLTMGKPEVDSFDDLRGLGEDLYYYVGCAERSSEHPLAIAVVKYCEEKVRRSESRRTSHVTPLTLLFARRSSTGRGRFFRPWTSRRSLERAFLASWTARP